jgi:leader peptidase (prepilin peptidase)/N-methyltransferase
LIHILTALILCVLLVLLSWSDIKSRRIPNEGNLALFFLALGYSYLEGHLPQSLAGFAMAAAIMMTVALVFRRLRGVDGLGGGDIKLAAALGAWVGPWGVAPMIAGASLCALASLCVATVWGTRLSRETAAPFGPFLALAGFCVWVAQTDPFALGALE